ncbi:MAG: thioesterase family protein [Bacteroidota bacterium]
MKITLESYKIKERYPVHWGDMDAAKHVNNLMYLRWAESARIAFVKQMGVKTSFTPSEIGPILGWQECKYIFPITFPDTVVVGIRCFEILEDRFKLECGIFSERHNRLAAISKQDIIPYDYGLLKKVPLPKDWVSLLQKL